MICEWGYLAQGDVHHTFGAILQLKPQHKPILICSCDSGILTEPLYEGVSASHNDAPILDLHRH